MNMFLSAIRNKNLKDPQAIVESVRERSEATIKRYSKGGWDCSRDKSIISEMKNNYELAIELAQYCIEWEALSHDEKEKIKNERGKQYQLESMKGKAVTEAQLSLLEKCGVFGFSGDRYEASMKIDSIIGKKIP